MPCKHVLGNIAQDAVGLLVNEVMKVVQDDQPCATITQEALQPCVHLWLCSFESAGIAQRV